MLFSPYNVPYMYVFRYDNLALDNKLVCSFLRKIISPNPRFPQLPIVLSEWLMPPKLFSVQFGRFTGFILVQLTFGQTCCLFINPE